MSIMTFVIFAQWLQSEDSISGEITDDEGTGCSDPLPQQPDTCAYLKSFTCFGWQIASGMVRM